MKCQILKQVIKKLLQFDVCIQFFCLGQPFFSEIVENVDSEILEGGYDNVNENSILNIVTK